MAINRKCRQKKADLKKLTQSIQEEFLKITKQVGRLVKEQFEQTSLAELEIKELAAKLKSHKISELEITRTLNK
jgi:diadenosine tetraphosphate (Ap4A) HIT family hydrolase